MKNFINNIRQKSDQHKNRIILTSVVILIVILIALWAIVGNGRRKHSDQNFFKNFSNDLNQGKQIIPQLNSNSTNQ